MGCLGVDLSVIGEETHLVELKGYGQEEKLVSIQRFELRLQPSSRNRSHLILGQVPILDPQDPCPESALCLKNGARWNPRKLANSIEGWVSWLFLANFVCVCAYFANH